MKIKKKRFENLMMFVDWSRMYAGKQIKHFEDNELAKSIYVDEERKFNAIYEDLSSMIKKGKKNNDRA